MEQINRITNVNALKLSHASAPVKNDSDFAEMIAEKLRLAEGIRFSKHAAQRVQERGIQISDSLMMDLNQAVRKAKEKGAKDVVIIGKSGAFIVNVPNNVVVTTMSGTEMKENIFTNIDSAVLL